ncbi:MAG: proton-conducting transporter membrane subunit [Bacteroidia bacterium]
MLSVLPFLILLPLLGFVSSLFFNPKNETWLSRIAFLFTGTHFFLIVGFIVYWLFQSHPTLNIKEVVLYKTDNYEFFIDFYFDKVTAVYLFVGSFLTFLVTLYSRDYLHREPGYKRFFNTVLLFYTGYVLTVFSGNLETLFVGWEILGITSFLLIAFYRDRYLPVKNAVKVFSVYRIGDVGLILAMWMSHHLFHENTTFIKLNNYEMVHEHFQSHSLIGVFISMMILMAACVKSAQLPFSSWLPRAMEGPTPSSAIFYGSLSVHMGVFLLIRTFPFWEHQYSVRILFGLIGLSTALVATFIARVQSSVKTQIAYSSIAQIGLIFIEVSFGLKDLALYHFAGNAFLRTYQLLVSPSVVTYKIREQFYNFVPRQQTLEDSLPKRIEYSFYLLSLKEWNLDTFLYKYYWNPFKWAGNRLGFLTLNKAIYLFVPLYVMAMFSSFYQEYIPVQIHHYLAELFAFIGLLMVLKAFTERKKTKLSWFLVVFNHFWVALAILFNEHFGLREAIFYLGGISVSGILGFIGLRRMQKLEGDIDLDRFHGHVLKHPKMALLMLIACLGVSGFPITPTFIGEDLIFSHIHENQIALAVMASFSFIVDGIALIRIYARVFLGPHLKSPEDAPYRSS